MNASLYKLRYLILLFCFLCFECVSSQINTKTRDILNAADIKPYGRYMLNDTSVELISSAVHFGFTFQDRSCEIYFSLNNLHAHNYLQYELDGVYQKRIRIEGNSSQPIVITAPKEGAHTVWIYKAAEASTGPIFIKKITAQNIKSIQPSTAPFIEFIGNSITCGAASDPSEIPCDSGEYHDHHNAYYAYGPRVARALSTNYILSSVSGIGIYRNWNSDGPTMPQVYEKADFRDDDQRRWNFENYHPQIVSIALGTNDFSHGDGKKPRLPFDSSAFVSNYIKFVRLVKSIYNNVQIALLSSPMLNGESRTTLQNCLTTVKQKIDSLYPADKKIALYFFQPMHPHGCGGHPNVEDHAILAEELVPFFRNLLK